MQRDSVRAGERVLLVDDWVETGSQARAVHQLVRQRGAHLVGVSVVVDQRDLLRSWRAGRRASAGRSADLLDPS